MKEKIIILIVVVLIFVGVLSLYRPPVNTVRNQNNNSAPTKPAYNTAVVGVRNLVSFGNYLTDSKGMTLYVFKNDKKLQSTCEGDCLKKWPPFYYDGKNLASTTDPLSKRMNIIKRSDGTYQYAYGTQPVYHFAGDKNPGETNGVGGDKWALILIR